MAAQLAGALRPPAQLAGALRPPRIELFFKTPAELKERLRDLTAAGYRSFNLVNKDKKDPMLAWVDVFHNNGPDARRINRSTNSVGSVPKRRGVQLHVQRPVSTELDDNIRAKTQSGFRIIRKTESREQRQDGIVVAREDFQRPATAVEELAP